jgi:methionyl-tRNA synthetase
MNKRRILITSALPYANSNQHLGNVAGAYLPADIFARYQRLKGNEVLYVCGSDEHGVPITISALNEKTTPKAIIDKYHFENKEAFENLGISFDNYSRTSATIHHKTAQEFFLDLYNKGILKEKSDKQLFCKNDNMFLPDRYVEGICPFCQATDARGDQCEKCGNILTPDTILSPKCKICNAEPEVKETKHLFFPFGNYQKELEEYVFSKKEWKDNVIQYCNGWFKSGLEDRAITRDMNWGIKVPVKGYEDKVIYVWIEAVLGYISATKEWAEQINEPEKWKEFWWNKETEYFAFIGKDNIVFHCIIMPAMFMANGNYVLPKNVPANEFFNFEGKKFSKSRNWGMTLKEFLDVFPPDPLRYTIAINMPESHDTDFYWADFQARNNNELADILGNFVNRTVTFAQNYFDSKVPERKKISKIDDDVIATMKESPQKVATLFEKFKLRDGVIEIMNVARIANKYFNDSQPWKTRKDNIEQCSTTINICLEIIKLLSIISDPIIPFTAKKMRDILNIPKLEYGSWDSAGELSLNIGSKINPPVILFDKVEDETIKQLSLKYSNPNSSDTEPNVKIEPLKKTITIDEFKNIDIRVVKVLECEKISKSNKLLKLKIKLGNEERTIVAGIAQHYEPEELKGKTIPILANLEYTKLMGIESQGMVLAAKDSTGKLSLLFPDKKIQDGGTVS